MTTTYDASKDRYANQGVGPDTFGKNGVTITPSDTVDFTAYPKAVQVLNAGNVVVLPLLAADDGAHLLTYTGAPTGFVIPIRVRRVMATGTTATCATIDDV